VHFGHVEVARWLHRHHEDMELPYERQVTRRGVHLELRGLELGTQMIAGLQDSLFGRWRYPGPDEPDDFREPCDRGDHVS